MCLAPPNANQGKVPLGSIHTHFVHSISNSTVIHFDINLIWNLFFALVVGWSNIAPYLTSHVIPCQIHCIFISIKVSIANKKELIETIWMWSTMKFEIGWIKGIWMHLFSSNSPFNTHWLNFNLLSWYCGLVFRWNSLYALYMCDAFYNRVLCFWYPFSNQGSALTPLITNSLFLHTLVEFKSSIHRVLLFGFQME